MRSMGPNYDDNMAQQQEQQSQQQCASSAPLYSMRRGEEMEALLAAQPFQLGQLVWVCKSKGLKKKRGKHNSSSSSADPQQQQQQQQQQQRLEPFLRAKIHALEKDDDEDGRFTVMYPKGSTYRVKRSNLWPILRMNNNINNNNNNNNNNKNIQEDRRSGVHYRMILVWPETDLYRKCCVQHTVSYGDNAEEDYFVEVGCAFGTTVNKVASTLLRSKEEEEEYPADFVAASKRHRVLGIDKSEESISIARNRYPHLDFWQWDILEEEEEEESPPLQDDTNRGGFVSELTEKNENSDNGDDDDDENNNANIACVSNIKESSNHHHHHVTGPSAMTIREFLKARRGQVAAAAVAAEAPICPLVVAIDINGNRELDAVQSCLTKVQSLWQPRLIIVKSRALHQHIIQNPTTVVSAEAM